MVRASDLQRNSDNNMCLKCGKKVIKKQINDLKAQRIFEEYGICNECQDELKNILPKFDNMFKHKEMRLKYPILYETYKTWNSIFKEDE